MKIVVLNAEYYPVPPVQGGPIAQTLYETALSYSRGRMVVVSPWSDRLSGWTFDPELFRHVEVDDTGEPSDLDPETGLDARAGRYVRAAADLIETIGPDLIQIHNAPHLLPYLTTRFPNVRRVLFAHNPLRCNQTELNAIGQHADCVVFVSDFLRRQFLDAYPDARIHTEVIYNAVDTSRFAPDRSREPQSAAIRKTYDLPGASTLLFAGRPLEQKGLEPLIRSMTRISKAIPHARLLVVGTPGYGAEHDEADLYLRDMRRLAKHLKSAVRFVGYVDPSKMPSFYAASTVTVVPSLWGEPFGKVAIESMAAAVPVVASRRGGLPEIITHEQDGILVDRPEDEAVLADAIISLLADRKLQQRISSAGLDTIRRRFTTTVRLDTLKAFYAAVQPGHTGSTADQHPQAQELQHAILSAHADGVPGR